MPNDDSLDRVIPTDFPREVFNTVIRRVVAINEQRIQSPYVYEFHDAWMAVGYRFFTCSEHDKEFTQSINSAGVSPSRFEHYIQERELFGFFITGLALLESFAFSCYALGAILDSDKFPMSNPKSITMGSTTDKFLRHYTTETLTSRLDQLRNDAEFKEWNEIRNVLAHRLLPPRQITVVLYPPQQEIEKKVSWINDNIRIDGNTTSSRRYWLARTLAELINSADQFTQNHL